MLVKSMSRSFSRTARRIAAAAVLVLAAGPVYLAARQGSTDAEQKAKKQFYAPKDRLAAMKAASLYEAKPVGEANILGGPKQKKKEFQFHSGDTVICTFATPGSQMGGKTPKFGCKITSVVSADGTVQTATAEIEDSDPIKVKFGADDNEVYAEIVATRLMWALGY